MYNPFVVARAPERKIQSDRHEKQTRSGRTKLSFPCSSSTHLSSPTACLSLPHSPPPQLLLKKSVNEIKDTKRNLSPLIENMTGPTVASSPTRPGPGGAAGGGSLSVRTRPVTRSSAAMSSGRSTRQQQRRQGANTSSPSTPSDDQPATPTKAGSSSRAETRSSGARGASVSTTTPPRTAHSSTDEASRESPTPTPTSPGDRSSSSQYHHSYPPAPAAQQQASRKRSAATAIDIDTTDNPRIDRLSLNTPITAGTGSSDPSPTSFRGSGGGGGGAGPELICLCTPAPKVPRPRNGIFCCFAFVWLSLLSFVPFTPSSPIICVLCRSTLSPVQKHNRKRGKEKRQSIVEEHKATSLPRVLFPRYHPFPPLFQPRQVVVSRKGV